MSHLFSLERVKAIQEFSILLRNTWRWNSALSFEKKPNTLCVNSFQRIFWRPYKPRRVSRDEYGERFRRIPCRSTETSLRDRKHFSKGLTSRLCDKFSSRRYSASAFLSSLQRTSPSVPLSKSLGYTLSYFRLPRGARDASRFPNFSSARCGSDFSIKRAGNRLPPFRREFSPTAIFYDRPGTRSPSTGNVFVGVRENSIR